MIGIKFVVFLHLAVFASAFPSNEGAELAGSGSEISGNNKSCLLPISTGSCSGFNVRYAFNQEKNACESFLFGGCDGNGNNFPTPNKCYETCGGNVPKFGNICEAVNCPKSNKYYIDKGCLPQYKPNSCCPYKFDCPDERTNSLLCHYRGLAFKIDQPVTQMMEDDHCNIDCLCLADLQTNRTRIECMQIVCPIIPHQFASEHPEEAALEEMCHVNGSSYENGQTILTLDPCKSCICVDGFTDENGPGCRETHCVFDPPRHDCVPVFDSNVCCPIKYECPPDDVEEVSNEVAIIRFKKGDDEDKSVKVESGLDACLQPKQEGPCEAFIPSYFYNVDSGDCEPFTFGGCHGNDNRFGKESECRTRCIVSARENATTPSPVAPVQIPDVCKLPSKTGPCRAYKGRFFFDEAAGVCKRFKYGGCRGNANNFNTIEQCQQKCVIETVEPATKIIETDVHQKETLVDPQCTFGNLTLDLGDRLKLEDPCVSCVCSTPPEVTCTLQSCPVLDILPDMTCSEEYTQGQCCPTISCTLTPVAIDVCEGNTCDEETEVCEVQENAEGDWLPPIAVCIPASSVLFL